MAEIGFYHLTRTPGDQALPALLGRTLKAGHRALVVCGDAARVAALDAALWACAEPDWLPHGTQATGDADMQPIWLATPEDVGQGGAPNGARYLFLLDGTRVEPAAFERVFDLFDGNDAAAVAAARARWAAAKAAGHGLTYWRQTEAGWEKGQTSPN
jgi:DNA polymerase-3 subunit chi